MRYKIYLLGLLKQIKKRMVYNADLLDKTDLHDRTDQPDKAAEHKGSGWEQSCIREGNNSDGVKSIQTYAKYQKS